MNFKMLSCGALAVTTLTSFGLTASSAQAASIVTNGGFEAPGISGGTFGLFPSIPGWQVGEGGPIELQNNIAGSPFEGNQFLELDSTRTTSIFQDLATVVGRQYRLNFAFSARPNVLFNTLNVGWGSSLVDALSANGVGKSNTVWNQFSYLLTATNSTTRLSFGNLNEPSNSLGAYVDAVSVTAVPTPALLPGLIAMGVGMLRKRKAEAVESES